MAYETAEELAELQRLLDESWDGAGEHLHRIITPERRVTAEQLVDRLVGMRLLVLATATADGRPIAGPVDGMFFHGRFWFGSAPDSVRFRHIAKRPAVSATHLDGEPFAVTVHGTAVVEGTKDEMNAGKHPFVDYCVEIYGPGWTDWAGGALYARIEPARMLTFAMDPNGV
jgi:hypothetical protein